MMPLSEIKELKDKVKQLQAEKEMIGATILFEVTRVLNTSDIITEQQRDVLVAEVWKGRHLQENV